MAWEAEMFRLLAANVLDYAIFVVDPDRHILSWNKGAERLLGYSEEEIVGAPVRLLLHYGGRRAGRPPKGTGRGARHRARGR